MKSATISANLKATRLETLKPLGLGLLVASFVLAMFSTSVGRSVRSQVELDLGFRFRSQTERGQPLSSRLKILAFDDRTTHSLGRKELKLSEWQRLIEAIGERKPRSIIIDHAFPESPDSLDAAVFIFSMKTLNVPLYAAADLYPPGSALGTEVNLDREEFRLETYQAPLTSSPITELVPYGPDGQLQRAFTGIGQRSISNSLYLEPLTAIKSERVIPHWSLLAFDVKHSQDRLTVNGQIAPTDETGRLQVNQLTESEILKNTINIKYAFDQIDAQAPLSFIAEGDTVIVLPRLYTGHGEWMQTPVGKVPSSFVKVSAVNSALTGNWVQPASGNTATTVLLSVGAAYLAFYLPTSWFFTALIGVIAAWVIGATSLFAVTGWLVPWLTQVMAILTSGLLQHGMTQKLVRGRADVIRQDLQGVIAREKLAQGGDRDLIRMEATEQVVTIMFIDIVGFSRAAERQTPKEAFSSLKSLINTLRKTITEFGGSVDRTMGDGMLCVFGAMTTSHDDGRMHADRALRCAESIQRENIKRITTAKKTGKAVFPVRIGINTTGVYIGNLGDADTTDFTVIGNGVNFANRLESACDRHMVMIGASTRDLLFGADYFLPRLRKRYIRIKHHDELVEAYEFDPFYHDERTLIEGDEAYRTYVGAERSDTRWPVPDTGLIRAMTDQGDGDLVNFSHGGFTLKLPGYFAKGVIINLEMDTADGCLGEKLESIGLAHIVVEVRWARPSGEGYIHGCAIKNLNDVQCSDIVNLLRESLQNLMQAANVELVG